MKPTQGLPAEDQLVAVNKKLRELHPGFDRKLMKFAIAATEGSPHIENGVVAELGFVSDYLVDLAPLQARTSLTKVLCGGMTPAKGAAPTCRR